LYYAIRSGSLLTSVHNLYLNFIIESGLLGLFALGFLAAIILKALRFAWRHRESYDKTPLDALFAMLITIVINVGADSTFRPYALYLMLTWSAVLITHSIPLVRTQLVAIRYRVLKAAEPIGATP
jgi:O-antigen ligase